MANPPKLKVAVLVDLTRGPHAGGHIKGWESLAAAAALEPDLPLDLTVFFSGPFLTEQLAPHVRLRQLPPVFSTARLKFLPYIPDHTDLAPWHPGLARELAGNDVVHTTDAYFAFTRTAEKLHRQGLCAMTHGFHTDQPSYARIFMTKAIREALPFSLQRLLIERWHLPERKEASMRRRLMQHLRQCDLAMAFRTADLMTAGEVIGQERTRRIRLATDKTRFNPARTDCSALRARYGIPEERCIVLFVGRLDEGKNIYTLIGAMKALVSEGLPLHLVAAGIGPASDALRAALPGHATVAGYIEPDAMAALYASGDVLAMVSEVEIKSSAMVEALASGLPALVAAKSGVDKLFPPSPALHPVTGGVEAWRDALRRFTLGPDRTRIREAAQRDGPLAVADWRDVLRLDYFPTWQEAAGQHKARHA